MKNINNWSKLFLGCIAAWSLLFVACEEENITKEKYDYPDIYVALIKVSPAEVVALSDLTIEGNDLDYVKAVRFWNDDAQLDIPQSDFKLQTKDSIVVNVPEDAPIGKISVVTNDDQVITWLNGLVGKPITLLDVTPVIVAEGDSIVLKGENFDLVKAVRLSQGDKNVVVPRTSFKSVSLEDSTLVITIPAGAPIGQVAVITDYDQMIVWEKTLTERTLSVLAFSPAGTVVVGTDITVKVTNIDLVKSVAFGTNALTYTATKDDSLLVVSIPSNMAVGNYALNITTWNGVVKVADFDIVRLALDLVWDAGHVYFDFDGKDSGWGDCPQTVENDANYSISGSYFHVKTTAKVDWYGLLFRTGGDNLNVSGVTVDKWVVKYDINVLGKSVTSIKIRLGDFWYITGVQPNIGGWYTISAPLNEFKDNDGNGKAMTNADVAALASKGDFGLADGGAGGEYDVLIDNVRFESKTPYVYPVADPAYVYFDFDGKGSWWGDCPQTVENDPAYSISGSYFHVKATAKVDWYGLFFRNGGDNINVSGVTVNDWVVRYDINVLGADIQSIKVRLGSFWFITSVNPNLGGWYTFTAPLSRFRGNDGNGDPMTDADIAALTSTGDFGLADGGKGGEYDVLIDNVRFEPK
ncbi:MAG: glycan-binding surface protein [Candidatus Azobacteroides sp.]|nr:glycan-binding surface protein [Candidatus Azobacteroides sp.]